MASGANETKTQLKEEQRNETENPPAIQTNENEVKVNQTPTTQTPATPEPKREDMTEKTPVPKFIYGRNPATLGQRFLEWLELFDLAMAINGSKDDHKKGHLILNMGDELQTVYRSKKKEDNSDTYAEVRKMLEDHLKPKTVVFTEVMVFRRAMRQQDESANEYAVRLRQLSKNCKFTDIDKEILQQFIVGIGKMEIEKKCCMTENLTLDQAIEFAETIEGLEANLHGLHKPTQREMGGRGVNRVDEEEASVNQLQKPQRSDRYRHNTANNHSSSNNSTKPKQQDGPKCDYCGRVKHQSKDQCPAKGKQCSKCQKLNHFAAVCRSDQAKPTTGQQNGSARSTRRAHDNPKAKTVNQMTDGNRVVSESEYCEFLRYKESTEWACNAIKLKHRSIGRVASGPRRSYSLLGLDIDCLVDTGAPINIISAQAYNKLHPKPELSPCRTRYYPYGEQEKRPLPIKGQFTAKLSYRGKELNAGFIVLEGEAEHLMSYQTAIALGIIQMDERDVSALKKGAGHPEGRPTNFQKAYNVSEGGNTSL